MSNMNFNILDLNNNDRMEIIENKKSLLDKKFTPSAVLSASSASSLSKRNNDIDNNNNKMKAILTEEKNQNEKENHFMTSFLNSNNACVPDISKSAKNVSKKNNSDVVKYGELVVLGHNGCISQTVTCDEIMSQKKNSGSIFSNRRKSKFLLESKEKPTGVKPSAQFNCHNKQDLSNVISKNENHSVTYTLSRTHQVIVQYVPDEKTDMFQIGRSSESAIDFIVLDTVVPQLHPSTQKLTESSSSMLKIATAQNSNGQSTISRYSCRIIVDRQYPYTARIYAAGFDSSKRIFLGEKATKWKNEKEEFDGVTTNGVLLMHPANGFAYDENTGQNKTKYTNEWMEVSVCGAVFNLDENRLTPCLNNKKNSNINNDNEALNKKSNILRDGTLIDLCGATLLWRSTESLKNTPNKQYLEMNLDYLNRLRPQCPVGFKTLVFPSSASPSSTSHLPSSFLMNNILLSNNVNSGNNERLKISQHSRRINNIKSVNKNNDRIPMVYLKCGHVHGQHDWGMKKDNERECPLCRKVGPYVQLLIGIEPNFYCDSNIKSSTDSNTYSPFKPYAFLPCGHMSSEATCRYWSQIKVPQGVTQNLCSLCPFCAVPLCKEQPIVKIILQEGL